jgi:hypothetical protein
MMENCQNVIFNICRSIIGVYVVYADRDYIQNINEKQKVDEINYQEWGALNNRYRTY